VRSAALCSDPDQRGVSRPNPCDIGAYETNDNDTAQTISFTSSPPENAIKDEGSYTVSAQASSGLSVTLSIDPSSSSVCSLSGSTVTFIGAGTCTIDANQAGDNQYLAAPQAQQTFNVYLIPQTITFTSTPPTDPIVGDTYVVSATGGGSGNPVTFIVDGSSTSVCSISGSTVTFLSAGRCIIDADQAGNADYNGATASQFITVYTTKTPAPTISKVTPMRGAIGARVVIVGTNLTGATVAFNGAPSQVTKDRSSRITTVVPAGATSGTITVSTIGGSVNSKKSFTVR
jgi:hypothetical protein